MIARPNAVNGRVEYDRRGSDMGKCPGVGIPAAYEDVAEPS
jgi:hypothetical protein